MSGFSGSQLTAARLLFELPEARGFALAGGSALLALGTIDRPTRDIDAFAAPRGPRPSDGRSNSMRLSEPPTSRARSPS